MITKPNLQIAVVAMLVICTSACDRNRSTSTRPIKVGVILPLTGPLAEPGKNCLNGIRLAISTANNLKSNQHIDLIVEDSRSDAKTGVSAANKLISVDRVKVILGDIMSSVAMAIAPIAEKQSVVLLSPGASNPNFTGLGKYIFRNWVSDNYDGLALAEYLRTTKGVTVGAVIYVNNEYGVGIATAFKETFEQAGGRVVLFEGYQQGATDFRTIIAKCRETNDLQFIYLPGQPIENGHLVKQIKENDLSLLLAANLSVESNDFKAIVGVHSGGIIYTSPAFDPDLKVSGAETFLKQYEAQYSVPPDVAAAHGFDAANILMQALKDCSYDLDRLHECIARVKDFPGISGKTSFTENGDVRKDIFIKIIQDDGSSKVLERFSAK